MINKIALLLVAAGACAVSQLRAAAPLVDAALTPDSIGIGDRFTLSVEVEKDVVQLVEFPHFEGGDFGNGLEIVARSVDTLSVDGRRVKLRADYTMQAFEEGEHRIGRFPVMYLDKNIADTLYSESELRLEVGTFEIDTLTQTIYDIKPPMNAPLRVGEFSGYAAIALGALLLLLGVAAWFTGRSFGRKGSALRKPSDPPHVVAMEALQRLHDQKLWQSGRHKAYYTRLSDILREYIDGRFDIRAMEMTSDEILSAAAADITPDERGRLGGILQVSDLVKFAKFTPDAGQNDEYWHAACNFVENTKPQETAEDEDNKEEEQ